MKLQATKTKPKQEKFQGRFAPDGGLDFGLYTKIHLKKYIKENPGMAFELNPLLPESNDQRRFFEGAICPLIAFYQEGMDHRDYKDREKVRQWLKIEFNGEFVELGGKIHKVAQSTKNRLNQGFLERVEGYIQDNYAPPVEALNPKSYQHWKDAIFPYGGPDNYIDYLVEKKIL